MIFSDGYKIVSAVDERKFKEALEERDLEIAVTILEKLPRSLSNEELIWRSRVLIEGYRAIVEIMLEKDSDELTKYRKIGTIEEVRAYRDEVESCTNLSLLRDL